MRIALSESQEEARRAKEARTLTDAAKQAICSIGAGHGSAGAGPSVLREPQFEEACGEQLALSSASITGYKGVYKTSSYTGHFSRMSVSFAARHSTTTIGTYSTAKSAAVARARWMSAQGRGVVLGKRPSVDSEAGRAAASTTAPAAHASARQAELVTEACGFQLPLSKRPNISKSGYEGVSDRNGQLFVATARPYVYAKSVHIGCYSTAVEAAVARQRWLAEHGAAPAAGGAEPERAISHAEEARRREETIAASLEAVRANAAEESDDSDDEDCCIIFGCKDRLLRCHGLKRHGEAIGCAANYHVVCEPCLEKFHSVSSAATPAASRRSCPVCKCELSSRGGVRDDPEKYALGLLKVQGTW